MCNQVSRLSQILPFRPRLCFVILAVGKWQWIASAKRASSADVAVRHSTLGRRASTIESYTASTGVLFVALYTFSSPTISYLLVYTTLLPLT